MSHTAKKGLGIQFDNLPTASSPTPRGPVTGVGQHIATTQQTRQLQGRIGELQAEVQRLEGERGAQHIDASLIRPSRWANRHETSFQGPAFEVLKAEIADASGNVQPIKVRPLPAGEGARYEIVFGHRRHRACLDLGLPVLAVVADLDDRALFAEMERENRGRKDLSPWEQGMMYRRALDASLFPSQRTLAQALGLASSTVTKAVALAELPAVVVSAFASPADVQYRWVADLRQALERDEAAVLARAQDEDLRALPAVRVAAELVAASASRGSTPSPGQEGASRGSAPQRLRLGSNARAEIRGEGRELMVKFNADLSAEQWAALERALRKVLQP